MRILHTSDWHLGKKLENFSRLPEQEKVLQEITEIAEKEKADCIIIAGDLFDSFNPSGEAVELFYKTLKNMAKNGQRPVIAIAGNHDAPDRIEAPDPLARECGIIMAGNPDVKITSFHLASGLKVKNSDHGFLELEKNDWPYPLRLLLTPYANEFRLKTFLGINDPEKKLREILTENWARLAGKYCDQKGVNMLVTHLFMMHKDSPVQEEPESEKPILHIGGAQPVYTENIPGEIQYTALGHLHQQQSITENHYPVVYSSSPLAYSFSEAGQPKFVMITDLEPGQPPAVSKIKLKKGRPLVRKKFNDIGEATEWLRNNPETWVELTMVTENFLPASQRKQLFDSHDGIVNIIPELTNTSWLEGEQNQKIDIQKDRETLFKDYFYASKGYDADEEILSIFREIVAGGDADNSE